MPWLYLKVKLWPRCDVDKVKAKTAEITKKDVGLNNLLMRSKWSLRVCFSRRYFIYFFEF